MRSTPADFTLTPSVMRQPSSERNTQVPPQITGEYGARQPCSLSTTSNWKMYGVPT